MLAHIQLLKVTPKAFKPKQTQTPNSPTTFTVLDAGEISMGKTIIFLKKLLSTEHSDITVKVLNKAIEFDIVAKAGRRRN